MRAIIKEEVPPIVKAEIAASEKRVKEYIDLKIETVNARIDAVDQKLTAKMLWMKNWVPELMPWRETLAASGSQYSHSSQPLSRSRNSLSFTRKESGRKRFTSSSSNSEKKTGQHRPHRNRNPALASPFLRGVDWQTNPLNPPYQGDFPRFLPPSRLPLLACPTGWVTHSAGVRFLAPYSL